MNISNLIFFLEYFLIVFVGLAFGSFIGMLTYRIPNNVSLFKRSRSFCPICDNQLTWYENIPLFSYLFLKGKCKKCKNKISILYPIIETITMLISIFAYMLVGFKIELIFILIICYILIGVIFIFNN